MLYILLIVVILYFYYMRKFQYFSQRNIKHESPVPIFGNHTKVFFARRTNIETACYLYKKYSDEKYVGYYRGTNPEIIVRDPDLVKYILNENFLVFPNRGVKRDAKIEPLMLNMLSEEGDAWKLLRTNLSSAFSSSRIKSMFPIVVDYAEKFVKIAHNLAVEEKEFDAHIFTARFTIDLIGACGFGIDMNAINNEQSLFIKLRDYMFIKSKLQMILFGVYDLFPQSLINKVSLLKPQVREIIMEILDSVRSHRQNDDTQRNDFINILLELGKAGKLTGDSLETDDTGKYKQAEIEFDNNRIAAQLFIYFIAGFETSSTTMSYAMHQLAHHHDIQQEVQKEIDTTLAKHDGRLCYESVSEMLFLEMVVKESLRLFPPAGLTTRASPKDCSLPGVNGTIKTGTRITIPIHALHMDEMYFDNPEEFDPKRFSNESSQPRHKYAYIPFGEGPRKCIGARFGTLNTMVGLAAILHKYNIKPSQSTRKNIRPNRAAYLIQFIDGGLPLKLTMRE
ncbi:cytochrome P450 6B5-like [Pieris brassicae]|uniref:cytochrome P450 6B5-like n=1 Tax=Pieris brassicae TaxID=7116 RepID=UPI001E65F6C7|nr:cytochrome P450 6B5-like [Pieris brassicae]